MNAPTQFVGAAVERHAASTPSAREVYEQTRRVGDDVAALAQTARQAIGGVSAIARDGLERRPYATLAVAAGVGYVLGGGMPVAVVRVLLGLGGRLVVERAIAQLAMPK